MIFFTTRFFFCLLVLTFFKLSPALGIEKIPLCKISYDSKKQELLSEVRELEFRYSQYRWIEQRIRQHFYEHLWKARVEAMEPLDKDKRMEARREEERLESVLKELESESLEASNGILKGFHKLQDYALFFRPACNEKRYEECLDKSFQPIHDVLEQGIRLYDAIFESEREYRKAVELTAGGRDGLYPKDSIERPVDHQDFFSRFELERRQKRFIEDTQIMDYFHALTKQLTDSFPADQCCLSCGITDWQKKTDRSFHETLRV